MNRAIPLSAALVLSTFSAAVDALALENVCEREMKGASVRYDVPLGMLYAVGLTESGRKESLQPFAMNVEGRSYFATSIADGIRHFEDARRGGARLIDIGCMQINHYYHASEFTSLEAMFEPQTNVDYAARFLKTLREREGSWTLAVARYHAGPNNDPAQKQYVCTVIANMVASGFGSWTEPARRFCG